ncbi:MAG: CBS domain-containing protein [Nitrospinae bacterium]|nr:CBS domain-containing protein [Nitrospinota bacterium]
MFVGEIMSKELITLFPNDKISAALKLMVKHDVRQLPVVDKTDKSKLLGIVTSRDVKLNVNQGKNDVHELKSVSVESVMQRDLDTVTSKTFVQDAARLLYIKKTGGFPVVDKGKLVGIITYQDILGVFIELMDGLQKSARIDVQVKNLEDVEEIKRLLESKDCKMIGIGQVSEKHGEEVYSFRIKHRETLPLCNLLSNAGYKVVEHFC